MIAFGILVLVCCYSTEGAPTTALPTTVNPAILQFRQIVAKSVEGLWHSADTNHDGKFTASDMNVIFVDYDQDHDHAITNAEFIGQFTKNQPGLNTLAKGMFLELDVNKNGEITNSDISAFYQRLDKDNNGSVTHDEFKTYFTQVLTLLFVYELQHQPTTKTPPH